MEVFGLVYVMAILLIAHLVAPMLGVDVVHFYFALAIASPFALFIICHVGNVIEERRKAEEEADRQRWWK